MDSNDLSDDEREHIIPYFWKQFENKILMPNIDVGSRNFVSVDTYDDYIRLLENHE